MSTSYQDLMQSLHPQGAQWRVEIPQNWMQGRTTYGGLSAALCLAAVNQEHSDLPSLRSAQINFIGPVGGSTTITTKVLRRGKSVTFISAEMNGEQGLATQAIFCFGGRRESLLDADFTVPPTCPNVADSEDFFKHGAGPEFAMNFDCLLAAGATPISGADQHDHHMWIRFKEKVTADAPSLLAIGDMPPPAVLPMFKHLAPISTMTWMVNFLQEEPTTEDGWWLLRTQAENVQHGYSSQDMQVWNSHRELVMTGRQSIAIFY